MPILYDFDLERKIVYERWEEPLDVEDVIYISAEPQKEKRFPPGMRALLIFNCLPSLSMADIARVIIKSVEYKDGFKDSKWGFVATEQKIIKVINRFRHLASIMPAEMRLFLSEEEAKEWLEIQDYIPPEKLLSTQNEKAAP